MPQYPVDLPQFLELLPAAADVVRRVRPIEVLRAHENQQRLGGQRIENVPAIKTQRAASEEVLLGVVGRARRNEAGARHVLRVARGDHGCRQPVVHGRQEHGERSAAGLPRRGQPLGVHQRMRGQVIQAPHRVPHLHPRRRVARQQHLPSRNAVLVIGRAKPREPTARPRVVGTLPLPHRVEGQHQESELHQPLAAPLVTLVRLPVQRVTHLKQHARIGWPAALRDVQVRGDVKARPALVDDLLHPVVLALERAGRPRVQRCSFRHPSGEFPESLPRPALPRANRVRRGEFLEIRVSLVVGALGEAAQIVRQNPWIVPVGDSGILSLRMQPGGQQRDSRWRKKEMAAGHRVLRYHRAAAVLTLARSSSPPTRVRHRQPGRAPPPAPLPPGSGRCPPTRCRGR